MFEMKQEKYGVGFSAVALHNDAVEEGSALPRARARVLAQRNAELFRTQNPPRCYC